MKKSFRKYNEENPQIYTEFRKIAFQLIGRNYKRIGARQILEVIRYHTMISGNDQFKVNNNYSADYARLFERDFPQYAGIFMKRLMKFQE
jgi:hypothetical protein